MSKIFELYSKNKDGIDSNRVWYASSNIKYSELIDHDNSLKTLNVVFNNGSQYQYKNVNVQDFLSFRDAESQGKALNQYIKSKNYEYEKLENADIATLDEELGFRMDGGIFVTFDGEKFIMKDSKDKVICEKEVKLTEPAFETICSALEAVGKQLHTDGKNFLEK